MARVTSTTAADALRYPHSMRPSPTSPHLPISPTAAAVHAGSSGMAPAAAEGAARAEHRLRCLSLIVAMADGRVIGKDNRLPWHLPEDLRHFKATTLGHAVIMGRKTFESIGRPLPGRRNLVLTQQSDWRHDGVETAASLPDALARLEPHARPFVIGGAQVYAQAMPHADHLVVTEIATACEGDAWFPAIDPGEWRESRRTSAVSASGLTYAIVEHDRWCEPLPDGRQLERIDLENPRHQSALRTLLDHYAAGPTGTGQGLAADVHERLLPGLQRMPGYAGWLVMQDAGPAARALGLINTFLGFSTFAARPLLNIHDLVVHADARGQGLGRVLMGAAERWARRQACCKLTLEVLTGNATAHALYVSVGYQPYALDPVLGVAQLMQKPL